MSLLETRNLSRHFEGVKAVDGVDFALEEGEMVSVIGPNGAGKTTLFNLLTALDRPTYVFPARHHPRGRPIQEV